MSELFEREGELVQLREVLRGVGAGDGRVVLIEGEAGIGKSALLSDCVQAAREADFTALTARAGMFERSLGFGVARELFEAAVARAPATQRAAVLAGAAGLVAPLLGVQPPGPPDAAAAVSLGESALQHGLYWLTSNLATGAPAILAIDDAQWCDQATLRWLAYLAQRLDRLPVAVLLTVRTGETGQSNDVLASLAQDPLTLTIRLGGLSLTATRSMLEAVYRREVPWSLARATHQRTLGNPFLVGELALELAAGGADPTAEAVERIHDLSPDTVRRSTLLRLANLGADAAALAKALAVLSHPEELRHAAALADLSVARAREAAELLARAAIIEPGSAVGFAHPLIASVVYDDIAPAHRASQHACAARLLAADGVAAERVCVHLLRSTPAADPWVVEQLRDAAAEQLEHGTPENAVAHLSRALVEGCDAELRALLLAELAVAEKLAGDPAALVHFGELARFAPDAAIRARAIFEQAELLVYAGGWEVPATLMDRALDELGELEPALAARMDAMRAALTAYDTRVVDRFNRRLPALRESVARGGANARPLTMLMAALGGWRGDEVTALPALVERGWGQGRFLREGPDAWALAQGIGGLIMCDELARAEELSESVLSAARSRGSALGYIAGTSNRLWVLTRRGHLAAAEAELRGALELALELGVKFALPSLLAFGVDVLLERPETADLSSAAEATRVGHMEHVMSGAMLVDARGRLRFADGDRRAGVDDLRRAGEIYTALGFRNPNALAWRSTLALMLEPGERAEAMRLVRDELRDAERIGQPRAIGVALRGLGLLQTGEPRLQELRSSVRALERSPARLEHARSLVELGAALRRANRRAEARAPLRAGLALAEDCGAIALAGRARPELRAAGARSRDVLRSGVDALTAAELRACEMAADGMSNPEIAQALFVTRGTVESQLHSAYLKLDVSSRGELAGALGR